MEARRDSVDDRRRLFGVFEHFQNLHQLPEMEVLPSAQKSRLQQQQHCSLSDVVVSGAPGE